MLSVSDKMLLAIQPTTTLVSTPSGKLSTRRARYFSASPHSLRTLALITAGFDSKLIYKKTSYDGVTISVAISK